jgi:hypothetical protein
MRKSSVVMCVLTCLSPLVPLTTPTPALATTVIPICTWSQLEVAVAWGPGAAAGNIGIPFIIANISKATCSLSGYPKLMFSPDRYKNHTVKVAHNVGMIFGNVKPRLVTIRPNEDASFGLNFGDAGNQSDPYGGPCIVHNIYVTLPVRTNTYNQNFETTVNFNFCFTNFLVGVTSIQPGPLPKEG